MSEITQMPSPYERACFLTAKGEAVVHLMKLRIVMTELSQEDRAYVVDEIEGLLDTLKQAA